MIASLAKRTLNIAVEIGHTSMGQADQSFQVLATEMDNSANGQAGSYLEWDFAGTSFETVADPKVRQGIDTAVKALVVKTGSLQARTCLKAAEA